jgi:hypothetical protein
VYGALLPPLGPPGAAAAPLDKQASGWAQFIQVDGKIAVAKWGGDCH